MGKFFVAIFILCSSSCVLAQEIKLYNPTADAAGDIATAVAQAKARHKYVLVQSGGNWFKWCIEFARFAKADPQIDSVINSGFILYHLNYSKENENEKVFASLDYPQRFGFPTFIILNENGQRIHTQNSEYLEDGKNSYNKEKVEAFLEMWTPHALDPKMYGAK